MKHKFMLCVLVVVAVGLIACQPADTFDAEAAKAEIEAVNAKFAEAIANQDAEAVAALYTEDAWLMPAHHAMLTGRDGVRSHMEQVFGMGVQSLSLTTKELRGHGNMAYEIGTFTATIGMGEEATMEDEGKYIVIWRKGADGQWRIHRDIWNSNEPLPEMDMEMSKK